MDKIFEEIKEFFGINKIFIFIITASMALFIDNREYKSLSESLVNLKTKELLNITTLIQNIEISKAIYYIIIFYASFLVHQSINKFFARINSRNTSLIQSINNIVVKFKFNDSYELSKRIEAQKYTEENYIKEDSKIVFLIKSSELFFCIGFFLVFASFFCGFLDLIIGLLFISISFSFMIKHQIQTLKIIPKYIASEIILNNSSIEKSINKYLNI